MDLLTEIYYFQWEYSKYHLEFRSTWFAINLLCNCASLLSPPAGSYSRFQRPRKFLTLQEQALFQAVKFLTGLELDSGHPGVNSVFSYGFLKIPPSTGHRKEPRLHNCQTVQRKHGYVKKTIACLCWWKVWSYKKKQKGCEED